MVPETWPLRVECFCLLTKIETANLRVSILSGVMLSPASVILQKGFGQPNRYLLRRLLLVTRHRYLS